ncbi:MAG: hypothetical protein R6U50_12680 [Desulfobacterales bacterium]
MIKAIFINGNAMSGKEEFVAAVRKIAENHGIVVCNPSITESVKFACNRLGVDVEPVTNKKRKLWKDVKKAWSEYNDGPFRETVKCIDSLNRSNHHILFVDVEEPEEFRRFKEYYRDECLTVLIRKHSQTHFLREKDQPHKQEFEYDRVIVNYGDLDLLEEEARLLFKHLMQRRYGAATFPMEKSNRADAMNI